MSAHDDRQKPGRGGPSVSRGVTMAAVGRLAGVSQVTVSRALSDPSKVSPETLRRIREAIEVTGYVPNAVAGALASRRSKLITALVPSITNIVYSSMIQTFTGELRAQDYQILMSETGFDPKVEEAAVATHLSRRPDAVLLTGIHHSPQTRRMLLAAEIPVVELWDITDTPIDLCVGFSHVESGRAVAGFCREAGYERAATVSAGDERAIRRKDAFVREFGRPAEEAVPEVTYAGSASLVRGREALARLVDESGFRDGVVVCSSDLLAHGVVIEAAARGLAVPGEIAVVGFGDQDYAAHIVPSLTTVRVDRGALGRVAAQAILARIEGGETPPAVTDLGFEIIRRDSA
jgi:LacI family gluconate utilization system Gnt-I transcriptional repressor